MDMTVKFRRIILAWTAIFSLACADLALAGATVPAGNRNAEQPAVPGSSVRRTAALKSSFDRKYEKVRDLLAGDRQLIAKIRKTASDYGIDPIHMVGALVGEHTYNVDAYDRLQSYYVKAASYTGSSFRFGYGDETITQFLTRSQFAECKQSDSYGLWTCREDIWDKTFRGKRVDGTAFPDNRFSAVFFQPFFAGQTFGLGQINPLTALMLSDLVAKRSGFEKLDEKDAAGVYKAIMDPDRSLAYMAAIIRRAIDDYDDIAGVDISKNPGITATLYNIGNSRERARRLAGQRASNPQAWPEENYYGWLVNDRLAELQKLL